MLKVSLKVASALLLLSMIITTVIYSRAVHSQPDLKPALAVSVQKIAKQASYEVVRYFPAVAEAQQSVAISSEIPGKVVEFAVDDGDVIEAGAVLFTLDTQLLETQKNSLQARAAQVLPEIELAQKRIKRQENLQRQSFSSEDNLDALKAQLKSLQANYESLTAQINDTNIRISKSTVRAPFDAVIQRRLLDEGAVINAGTLVLNLIGSKVIEVITGLPADVVSQLSIERTYLGYTDNTEVRLRLNRILPDINPITRTQGVKFLVEGDVSLNSNEYVKLALSNTQNEQGFWVPNNALLEGQRGVWELFALTQDNRVIKYSVDVLYSSNPESYVSSALADGTEVVIEGVHRLAQGIQVSVNPATEAL